MPEVETDGAAAPLTVEPPPEPEPKPVEPTTPNKSARRNSRPDLVHAVTVADRSKREHPMLIRLGVTTVMQRILTYSKDATRKNFPIEGEAIRKVAIEEKLAMIGRYYIDSSTSTNSGICTASDKSGTILGQYTRQN